MTWPPGPKQGPGPSLTVTPISEGCHLALLADRVQIPPGQDQGIDVDVKLAGVRCSAPADEHWVFKMHPSRPRTSLGPWGDL